MDKEMILQYSLLKQMSQQRKNGRNIHIGT